MPRHGRRRVARKAEADRLAEDIAPPAPRTAAASVLLAVFMLAYIAQLGIALTLYAGQKIPMTDVYYMMFATTFVGFTSIFFLYDTESDHRLTFVVAHLLISGIGAGCLVYILNTKKFVMSALYTFESVWGFFAASILVFAILFVINIVSMYRRRLLNIS